MGQAEQDHSLPPRQFPVVDHVAAKIAGKKAGEEYIKSGRLDDVREQTRKSNISSGEEVSKENGHSQIKSTK